MTTVNKPIRYAVFAIAAISYLIPIGAYYIVIARPPSVHVAEAQELLADPRGGAVLIDIREEREYEEEHIGIAVNWPFDEIISLTSADDVPAPFKNRKILLLCPSGIYSARAAGKLTALGMKDVFGVKDGMRQWIASSDEKIQKQFPIITASGKLAKYPHRDFTHFEQWCLIFSGFTVKGIYTLISLILIILLWRKKEADLRAVKWALIFFFLGENACLINYMVYLHGCHILEYSHSFGMLLCFSFFVWALLEGIDTRIIRYSDPAKRCGLLGFCGQCIKNTDVPCGFLRLFYFLVPVAAVISLMPLCIEMQYISFNTTVWGYKYNISHPVIYQFFEVRYCPILAITLCAVSFLMLLFKKGGDISQAKLFFAAGTGPLLFGLLRGFTFHGYIGTLVWYTFWEEVTEFLFICSIVVVLWIFRERIFKDVRETVAE
ncbi:MAG: rhodanese-like domain-containing protein [Planctomycetota bacterium]|jgi:rhodanese-related sulfurtransferase